MRYCVRRTVNQLVMVQKFKFNDPITKARHNPDKQLHVDMYSAGALPIGFKNNLRGNVS